MVPLVKASGFSLASKVWKTYPVSHLIFECYRSTDASIGEEEIHVFKHSQLYFWLKK